MARAGIRSRSAAWGICGLEIGVGFGIGPTEIITKQRPSVVKNNMGTDSRKAPARSPEIAAKTDYGIALGPLAQSPKELIKTSCEAGRSA